MTKEELEHIQKVCRLWLQQPDTASNSRLTISAGGALTRTVELVAKGLLTFDNVLFKSALDAKTGAIYSGLARQPDGTEVFFDTPHEKIEKMAHVAPPAPQAPASPPLRATQKRYQEAMDLLAKQQRDRTIDVDRFVFDSSWLNEGPRAANESLPQYLIYTGAELLGYTELERVHSSRERSGRFYPSEDYFNYAHVFVALPDAENEYLEEAAETAYGLEDSGSGEAWKKFNELSEQVEALALFVQTEDGQRMDVTEVRLEDLSHKYDDQTERWLYLTLAEQEKLAN